HRPLPPTPVPYTTLFRSGHLPALPPRAPRRGGRDRGDRRPAVARVGRGREPLARAKGPARDVDGLGPAMETPKRTPLHKIHVTLDRKSTRLNSSHRTISY